MSDQYDDGFYDGQQDQQVKIDKVLDLIEKFKKEYLRWPKVVLKWFV